MSSQQLENILMEFLSLEAQILICPLGTKRSQNVILFVQSDPETGWNVSRADLTRQVWLQVDRIIITELSLGGNEALFSKWCVKWRVVCVWCVCECQFTLSLRLVQPLALSVISRGEFPLLIIVIFWKSIWCFWTSGSFSGWLLLPLCDYRPGSSWFLTPTPPVCYLGGKNDNPATRLAGPGGLLSWGWRFMRDASLGCL